MRPITRISNGKQMVKDGDGPAHDPELFILKQLEDVQEQALEVTKRRIKDLGGLSDANLESKAKVSS